MTLAAARYAESVSVPINATDSTFIRPTNGTVRDDNPMCIRVIGDVDFHIAFGRPATTDDARVPANQIEFYNLGPNYVLHFLRATATDGVATATVAL